MKPLYDSMLDTNLLGRTFAGPTFAAWRKVAKILDAAPLNQDAHALHRELTGRDSAPREAFREAYLITPHPKQAGRSLALARRLLDDSEAKL